jgi:DNA-binding NarL/FixJ family response regulator
VSPDSDVYVVAGRRAEILTLLANGFSTPAAAALLGLSEDTVKTHSRRIRHRLGVQTVAEVMRLVESGRVRIKLPTGASS